MTMTQQNQFHWTCLSSHSVALTRLPVNHDGGDPGPGRLDELDVGCGDVRSVLRRRVVELGGQPRVRRYFLKIT